MYNRRLLLLSNSTSHGSGYLEWAIDHVVQFLTESNVTRVLFIPYALKEMDKYTATISKVLLPLGYQVQGIHSFEDPIRAVNEAQALFVGGGNTFRLLKMLWDKGLVQPIKNRVIQHGVPYIGSSAGTNVATRTINTTNDMPIVYPPTFEALSLVPFNINPHYIDKDKSSVHMGESRETRLNQFHEEEESAVLGLRECCLLRVTGNTATLLGDSGAKLFCKNEEPREFTTNEDLSFLL